LNERLVNEGIKGFSLEKESVYFLDLVSLVLLSA